MVDLLDFRHPGVHCPSPRITRDAGTGSRYRRLGRALCDLLLVLLLTAAVVEFATFVILGYLGF